MSTQERTTDTDGERPDDPIVRVHELEKHFPIKGGILQRTVGHVRAVDGVSFDIQTGETLGLVGESGCGKSTLGRTMARLEEATSGSVEFDGRDVTTASKRELKAIRRNVQMIFQDPASSLNPRMTVSQIITEPMRSLTDWSKSKREDRLYQLIEEVGLSKAHLSRAPHEFSGGQQQRVAIARALSVNPQFVIADEPTSALDVSVQADILNLLKDLQDEYDLTYLFISHDLSVVRHISDRVMVMYLGEVAEIAPTERLFDAPKHPYTRALLSSIPRASAGAMDDRIVLEGTVPSPEDPPDGCRFHPRCQEYIGEVCERTDPEVEPVDGRADHVCACHHY
ncbi:ABC transporter ATP-binding protein [Halomarina oriensis]|uniref:Dipeptide ABC transporter ATP-binding protein n=1 Tax=Halomarina oriensis TaxID=671145 RepID=A0A6B0GF21_9EURY|nr:dipeptide ABC transporter ATP-binding protein [Halomarina oriensis]MWG33422.1 dipeptide ABC transporter ATP-binding protein [Halomarina oriensis]